MAEITGGDGPWTKVNLVDAATWPPDNELALTINTIGQIGLRRFDRQTGEAPVVAVYVYDDEGNFDEVFLDDIETGGLDYWWAPLPEPPPEVQTWDEN